MADSILTKLAEEKSSLELKTMSKKALIWLEDKIDEIKNPSKIPVSIRREKFRETSRFKLGGLYFFYYNPITKAELPYYDKFPLTIILKRHSDGFLGLNLHYLPINYRIAFMKKLMPLAVRGDEGEITRIKITYDILNDSRRFIAFQPCIKRYLYTQLKSKILAVQPNEWDIATYLPVQQFMKAKAPKVWKESIKEIKRIMRNP